MAPTIMRTTPLDEWVIVTRFTQKDGYAVAHTKYPIPEETIERIANHYLIKHLEGYEKGYSYLTEDGKAKVKVTVEKLQEKTLQSLSVERQNAKTDELNSPNNSGTPDNLQLSKDNRGSPADMPPSGDCSLFSKGQTENR